MGAEVYASSESESVSGGDSSDDDDSQQQQQPPPDDTEHKQEGHDKDDEGSCTSHAEVSTLSRSLIGSAKAARVVNGCVTVVLLLLLLL